MRTRKSLQQGRFHEGLAFCENGPLQAVILAGNNWRASCRARRGRDHVSFEGDAQGALPYAVVAQGCVDWKARARGPDRGEDEGGPGPPARRGGAAAPPRP
jgi:hypothetical protein